MLFNSTEGPAIILALIYGFIMVYNSCRTRCKLTRQGIVPAGFSSWTYLYSNNGDDSSFLNVTGYNRATFEMLHAILYPPVDRIPRGRRPLLDTRGKLGLLLVFLTSKMSDKQLCLIFGIVPTTVGEYLDVSIPNLIEKRCSCDCFSRC